MLNLCFLPLKNFQKSNLFSFLGCWRLLFVNCVFLWITWRPSVGRLLVALRTYSWFVGSLNSSVTCRNRLYCKYEEYCICKIDEKVGELIRLFACLVAFRIFKRRIVFSKSLSVAFFEIAILENWKSPFPKWVNWEIKIFDSFYSRNGILKEENDLLTWKYWCIHCSFRWNWRQWSFV